MIAFLQGKRKNFLNWEFLLLIFQGCHQISKQARSKIKLKTAAASLVLQENQLYSVLILRDQNCVFNVISDS